jgi:hypothetical protein
MNEVYFAYFKVLHLIMELDAFGSPKKRADTAVIFDVVTHLFPAAAADLDALACHMSDVATASANIARTVRETQMTVGQVNELILLLYAGGLFAVNGEPIVLPRDASKFGPEMAYIRDMLLRRLDKMGHSGPFSPEQAVALARSLVERCRPIRSRRELQAMVISAA